VKVSIVSVLLAASIATAQVRIETLSTNPARVTGGDVLVGITAGAGAPAPEPFPITVDGRDVASSFHPGAAPGTLVGLVTGLANGKNEIRAGAASLEVTNYPVTGPVFSGPPQEPFVCQTDEFHLPDGTTLGPPLDANCSARTVVQYVYLPDGKDEFKPLPDLKSLPADMGVTTTLRGDTVNFIVRVETGTMDRGIYQNAVLHDPTSDPPVSPFHPPKGWNRRLVAVHGHGCPGGWYIQGASEGVSVLDRTRLGQGYALFTNTLNHTANNCNPVVAGEATMMGKEHFIETFGPPDWTISTGGSGGAYTSLQVADAFPGLIDGVWIQATFPDALSIAMAGLDTHLLMHYFTVASPGKFTERQQVEIGGYAGMKAMIDAANQAQRTDPTPGRPDIQGYAPGVWNTAVPPALRYDPVTNPKGARPTIFDAAKNVYGVNPITGAALRPYDNTGVQYGLNALNRGSITVEQFLDLNEKIGGVDADSNYIPSRTVGDAGAIRRAYAGGLTLSGKGGLAAIPIVDDATSRETEGYHYGWFHFALRERLRKANGDSANLVMWRSKASRAAAQDIFDHWMAGWKADNSPASQRTKVLRAKPAGAADGCYAGSQFVADPLPFTTEPVSECSKRYPVYSNPRKEAGGPLAADILKCQLKPVAPGDYRTVFSAGELDRLRAIFPDGVCDFSKPGDGQVPLVTWPSFGPSPVNLVYDRTRPDGP
jgi:hypothetical protein